MKKEELIAQYKQEMQKVTKGVNILLVDDDLILQGQMKKVLGHFFARIDCAQNGKDALALFERRRYHIIITDLTMPLMNGIALAKEIKSRDKEQSLFVISAHNESEKLIELINIGVDGFFLKPLNVTTLLELIKKRCEALYDKKMKEHYSKLLDKAQEELKERNRVLEETFFHLINSSDEKFVSIEKNSSVEEYLAVHKEDAHEIYEGLERLEESFNCLLLTHHEQKEPKSLGMLSEMLSEYAKLIKRLEFFYYLAEQIESISELLEKLKNRESLLELIMADITELFDALELFKKEVFEYKTQKNIFVVVSKIQQKISKTETLLRVIELP